MESVSSVSGDGISPSSSQPAFCTPSCFGRVVRSVAIVSFFTILFPVSAVMCSISTYKQGHGESKATICEKIGCALIGFAACMPFIGSGFILAAVIGDKYEFNKNRKCYQCLAFVLGTVCFPVAVLMVGKLGNAKGASQFFRYTMACVPFVGSGFCALIAID